MPKQRRRFTGKRLFLSLLIIIVIVVGVVLYRNHHKSSRNLAAHPSGQQVTGTTSKPTPHKATAPTNTNVSRQGGSIDQNGKTTGSLPPSSQWVSSASSNITLQQPTPNSVVRSGDTLSGTAKVSNVQFILKDDSVGLIAQGNLSVVNGKFAGTLQFTPHANTGKLEVYYPNPTNGAEEDIIEINVNFNAQ